MIPASCPEKQRKQAQLCQNLAQLFLFICNLASYDKTKWIHKKKGVFGMNGTEDKKPMSMKKKWALLVVMALVFGLIAGLTMYGVNAAANRMYDQNHISATDTAGDSDTDSTGNSGTSVEEVAKTPCLPWSRSPLCRWRRCEVFLADCGNMRCREPEPA